jgi:predicted nucleic acid-binding protein
LRAFFDTSVLVPVFLDDHQHHERSLKAFVAAAKNEAGAAHSLAEVYSTMTRLPGPHRLSGEQVLLFLENIRERLRLVTPTSEEYYAAIKESAEADITGGAIYDALIARCALKAKADRIYSWNTRHFERLVPRSETD